MIVCHCRVVTDRGVAEAVRSGARSLAGVCRSTGAGQDCGSCVFAVRRLMCEHEDAQAVTTAMTAVSQTALLTLPEVDVAAS